MTTEKGRTVQINLTVPDWSFTSMVGSKLRQILRPQRGYRNIAIIAIVLLIAGMFGLQRYNQIQDRNRRADFAAEIVIEGQAIESSSTEWANANLQTIITKPSELRNMLPAHTGWAALASLPLTKAGVVVLPTQLQMYPSPPAGVHSLLVSRLHDMNTYVVFRFVSCDGKGVGLVAASSKDEGITAVQQPFDLRTAKCPDM